jgi:para-aminobenzoate synthetase
MHGRTSKIEHDGLGLFKGIPSPFEAVRYHSLLVSPSDLPEQLHITAWCGEKEDQIIMGLTHKTKPIWTVQFHPESICTAYGQSIVNNFCSMVERIRSIVILIL